jgi:hypothetical protein
LGQVNYANDVIGGRFPGGEKAIAKNRRLAYRYAHSLLRGRFIEGESVTRLSEAASMAVVCAHVTQT